MAKNSIKSFRYEKREFAFDFLSAIKAKKTIKSQCQKKTIFKKSQQKDYIIIGSFWRQKKIVFRNLFFNALFSEVFTLSFSPGIHYKKSFLGILSEEIFFGQSLFLILLKYEKHCFELKDSSKIIFFRQGTKKWSFVFNFW